MVLIDGQNLCHLARQRGQQRLASGIVRTVSGGHRPSERRRESSANLLGGVVTVGPQLADDPQHVSGIDLVYGAAN